MRRLTAALQFITVLPVGRRATYDPQGMIPWFPVAGLLLGMLVALADAVAGRLLSLPAVAVVDVVLLAGLTGALHLDGLGDAADGLFSHRSRDQRLAIMKDSRVGMMGLVAVVACLALKWAGIQELAGPRWVWLVVVPAYARGAMLAGIRWLPYGRPAGGTGRDLFERRLSLRAFGGLAAPAGLSLLLGVGPALALLAAFVLVTVLVLEFYRRSLGCITGDMLGALTEVQEALLFLTAGTVGGIL